MRTYPHMCRDGHVEIGFSDSTSEACPLCAVLAALQDLVGNENVRNVWDSGPQDEGWQSEDLRSLFARADAAIERAEGK